MDMSDVASIVEATRCLATRRLYEGAWRGLHPLVRGARVRADARPPVDGRGLPRAPSRHAPSKARGPGSRRGIGSLKIDRWAIHYFHAFDPADADSVFGLRVTASINKVIAEVCRRAGLGEGSSHSPLVGMAQNLAAHGIALPATMQAGPWRSSEMVARYTDRLAADRSAVAQLPGARAAKGVTWKRQGG